MTGPRMEGAMSANTTTDLEIPPLRDGDRLTADEFHRRYEAMPHIINANLINGVVYVTPHFRCAHGEANATLCGLFGSYTRRLHGIQELINITWRVDAHNEPQPNFVARYTSRRNGNSRYDSDGFLTGVPEFVGEIADDDTVELDAGPKRELYQRIGVREYFLWRVREKRIDWWGLVDGIYQPVPTDHAGVAHSRVFPGFRVNIPVLLRDDARQVADTIDTGLASPEYQAFATGGIGSSSQELFVRRVRA